MIFKLSGAAVRALGKLWGAARVLSNLPAAVLALALTGCPAVPQGARAPLPAAAAGQQPPSPPGYLQGHEGRPYDVVSGQSLLTILAFRGGALAKAGHNHVIASHTVTGTFYVPEDVSRTSFELHVPVAELTIDEPDLRSQQGADFPADVPESAKEGTRHNMLSEVLLNAAQYPEIVLTGQHAGTAPAGSPMQAQVQVTLCGQAHTLSVSLLYSLQADQLEVSGTTPVRQSELGLAPFSALLGALQVQDELRVSFHFVARRAIVH